MWLLLNISQIIMILKNTQFAGWSGNSANISYKIDGNDKTGKADASVEIKKTDFDLNKNGKLVGDTAEWE